MNKVEKDTQMISQFNEISGQFSREKLMSALCICASDKKKNTQKISTIPFENNIFLKYDCIHGK